MANPKSLQEAVQQAKETAENAKTRAAKLATKKAEDELKAAEAAERKRKADEHTEATLQRRLKAIRETVQTSIDAAVNLLNDANLSATNATEGQADTEIVLDHGDFRYPKTLGVIYYAHPPSVADERPREAHIYVGWDRVSPSIDEHLASVVVFGCAFSDGSGDMRQFDTFGFSQFSEARLREGLTKAIDRLNH